MTEKKLEYSTGCPCCQLRSDRKSHCVHCLKEYHNIDVKIGGK